MMMMMFIDVINRLASRGRYICDTTLSDIYPVFIRGPWRETDRGKSVIVMEVPILRIPLSPQKKTNIRTNRQTFVSLVNYCKLKPISGQQDHLNVNTRERKTENIIQIYNIKNRDNTAKRFNVQQNDEYVFFRVSI